MGPIIRILLRVFAGVLIGWGFPEDPANMLWNDPAIVSALSGALLWAATEVWYRLAKRYGWPL